MIPKAHHDCVYIATESRKVSALGQSFDYSNYDTSCVSSPQSPRIYMNQYRYNQREFKREAQSVVPMHVERLVDQIEDVEYDDDGYLLEALPTPTCGTPIQELTPESSRESTPIPTPVSSPMFTPHSTPQSTPHSTPPQLNSARTAKSSVYYDTRNSPLHRSTLTTTMFGELSSTIPSVSFVDYRKDIGNDTNNDTSNDGNTLIGLNHMDQDSQFTHNTNDLSLEFHISQYMMQTALAHKNGRDKNEKELASSSHLYKEGLNVLKRLAQQGHVDSQYNLGCIYSSSVLGNPDPEESLRYFIMASNQGHADAAYRAALCLQEGSDPRRDAERALQFYKLAAAQNQPGALYELGVAYFYGSLGLTDNSSNRRAGVEWLERAVDVCDRTYNQAPYALAQIYEIGYKDLIISNGAQAVKLYSKSAELGHFPSAARLGRAYQHGELGCPQHAILSIFYFNIAAQGNDPDAQLALCEWYISGAGPEFPINNEEAYRWALRAASNGQPRAQLTVTNLLENSIRHADNMEEVEKWSSNREVEEAPIRNVSEQ